MTNERALVGLVDGFTEYASPTDVDYADVLTTGMVVLDTNVLLNLYRYHSETREALFRIVEALGPRLFIPHQVAAEYWANREGTIRTSAEATTKARDELSAHRARARQSIAAWANRVAPPPDTREQLDSALATAFDEAVAILDGFRDASLGAAALNTSADPVLARLVGLLEQRVGLPLSENDLASAREEADRRIAESVPPGFADSGKEGDARHGDFLVWRQMLDEAAARKCDVLLVTGDVKEDWWRQDRGEIRGPRLELSRELGRTAGVRLYMLQPASLLKRAIEALQVPIDEDSVRAAETVDRLTVERRLRRQGEGGRYLLDKLPDGRGGNYVEILLEMASIAEETPSVDAYVEEFQLRFPSITLKDVARRRIRVLESLGFVAVAGGRVSLTDLGRQFLEERSLELVQDTFMRRIAGAPEVADLASLRPRESLRADLRDDPPAGLSSTQAGLVLRWMEQLDLV